MSNLATLENILQFLHNPIGPKELTIKVSKSNIPALTSFWNNVAIKKKVITKYGILKTKQQEYSRNYSLKRLLK